LLYCPLPSLTQPWSITRDRYLVARIWCHVLDFATCLFIHPTGNLLSTGNILIMFLPQVTPFSFFPQVTPFPPGKLSVVCEIQVGLVQWEFSRDFACSLTPLPILRAVVFVVVIVFVVVVVIIEHTLPVVFPPPPPSPSRPVIVHNPMPA
jgi:hypothetical protein